MTFDEIVQAWKAFPGRRDLRYNELANKLGVSIPTLDAFNRKQLGGPFGNGWDVQSVVTPSVITAGDNLWRAIQE